MASASQGDLIPKLVLLGALSGLVSGPVVMIGTPGMGAVTPVLVYPFLGIAPGLLFGLIVGSALYRRGFLRGDTYLVYVVAAAMSCWAATMATIYIVPGDGMPVRSAMVRTNGLAGAIGGLIGAGLLTAVTMMLIPPTRHVRSCAFMIGAGGCLGYLIEMIMDSPGLTSLIFFYVAWQSGYAACLGASLGSAPKS